METAINDMEKALQSATPLTPLQLNGIKLDPKHTVLTPELLEKMVNK